MFAEAVESADSESESKSRSKPKRVSATFSFSEKDMEVYASRLSSGKISARDFCSYHRVLVDEKESVLPAKQSLQRLVIESPPNLPALELCSPPVAPRSKARRSVRLLGALAVVLVSLFVVFAALSSSHLLPGLLVSLLLAALWFSLVVWVLLRCSH
jgi:hypothetical protein